MEIWLADQQSQTQLNIVGVTREDLRSYLCVARNSMGEMSRKIKLTGKASLPYSIIPHSDGTIHANHFQNSLVVPTLHPALTKHSLSL